MRACGSRAERLRCLSCSIFVRIKESVIRSAMSSPLLVSTTPSLFQSITTRSTTWTARPSPRRHCTPRNHSRKNLYQKLPGRKATLKNRSHTSIMRVAETCAQTLPQRRSRGRPRKDGTPAQSRTATTTTEQDADQDDQAQGAMPGSTKRPATTALYRRAGCDGERRGDRYGDSWK